MNMSENEKDPTQPIAETPSLIEDAAPEDTPDAEFMEESLLPAEEDLVHGSDVLHTADDDLPMDEDHFISTDENTTYDFNAYQPSEEPYVDFSNEPAEMDVEAALAALGTLNNLADPAPERFSISQPTLASNLPQPPLIGLDRGTTASVVPALLMIAAGVFLTFFLASGNPLPDPTRIAGGGLIIVGISLLSWWISTGRWARGSLFMGMISVGAGVVLLFI